MEKLAEESSNIEPKACGTVDDNAQHPHAKIGDLQKTDRTSDRVVSRPQAPILTYRDEFEGQHRQDANNAQLAKQAKSDLEHGDLADDQKDDVLANAFMVADCSPMTEDNSFFPLGVEFDPMAKERAHKRTVRFLYAAWVALLAVILLVGLTLGLVFRDKGEELTQFHRDSLGIRETLEIATGLSLALTNSTRDLSRVAYLKALDWIVHTDPTAPSPEDPNLLQRFLAAYIYFATSVEHEWALCGPPTPSSGNACTFQEVHRFVHDTSVSVQGSRWLSGTNECNWVGISCDEESKQIVKIKLNGVNMTGIFPEGIQYLTSLTSLQMGVGHLRGPLPTVVALMELVHLELHSHQFTGTIPSDWFRGTWNRLEHLDISHNELTGTIASDIANWKGMQWLVMNGNRFSGTVPFEIAALESLSVLYFNDNSFTGPIPSTIGTLAKLQLVDASNNKLAGPIPNELFMAKSLTDLFLSKNHLTGTLDPLYEITSLIAVRVEGNQLKGTISSHIGQLTHLQELLVRDNEFTGFLPTEMGLLLGLQFISIAGNNFLGSVPIELCTKQPEKGWSLYDPKDWNLEADCLGDASLLACPEGCCTICCRPGGKNCHSMFDEDDATP